MSLSNNILNILFGGYSASYRHMWRIILGSTYPTKNRNTSVSKETLYTTLARLKRNGYAVKKDNEWVITRKGKEYFRKKINFLLPSHSRPHSSDRSKTKKNGNIIVAFDIPEKYRRKRDWLRSELIFLDFTPIQKSVWFGSAPLPQKFIENLNSLKILHCLKFFKAEEKEIV
jgi:DNA-binding transcriptional regulator PaaX